MVFDQFNSSKEYALKSCVVLIRKLLKRNQVNQPHSLHDSRGVV